jgi:hypothetical protein
MLDPNKFLSHCLVALVAFASACTGDDDEVIETTPETLEWPHLGCDPLVPSYCAAPFPSNVYTVADETSPTGRKVWLKPEVLPVDTEGRRADPGAWNALDGFSPGAAISVHLPGVTQQSLIDSFVPTPITIEGSLTVDSPSLLLDTETGELVPHFVDLDATGDDDSARMFMLRPAIRLEDSRRYIVAIHDLRGDDGKLVEPSEVFAALRDGTESDDPTVEPRRGLYADIFERLHLAGVEREDLIVAWDFTTSSRDNNTAWMVHMRDEALALVGPGGPQYTIKSVEEDFEDDPDDHIAYRIYLDMRVPMYLDHPEPLASLTFGADGLPDPNPAMPWAEFEVEILIPNSAMERPAALLQYGHGLLGEKEEIEFDEFLSFVDTFNYVIFGVDFIGFAADDEVYIGAMLGNGRFQEFQNSIERQHQGMLNSLLAMRMMKTSFAADPDYGHLVDPSSAFYWGISQGGIYGGTYMSLTTDIQRGTLGVPGMPYSLLLSRSVDFDRFFDIIRSSFTDARDHMMLLNLAQMLWDRIEPNGYVPYIIDDTLPNTPSHDVLIRAAIGDHQVTNYGAHVMARTLGIPYMESGVRSVAGLEMVPGPVQGSAFTEYDFGLPPVPLQNLPQRECGDPHDNLSELDVARQQLDTFLREGRVENFCDGGVCSFPELSGC